MSNMRVNLRRSIFNWDYREASNERHIGRDTSDDSYTQRFIRETLPPNLANIDFDTYKHYYETAKGLFFQLSERREIKEFYDRVKYIVSQAHRSRFGARRRYAMRNAPSSTSGVTL